MNQLRTYATHYKDGLITAHEMMQKIVLDLARIANDIPDTCVEHDLADELSEQLLK